MGKFVDLIRKKLGLEPERKLTVTGNIPNKVVVNRNVMREQGGYPVPVIPTVGARDKQGKKTSLAPDVPAHLVSPDEAGDVGLDSSLINDKNVELERRKNLKRQYQNGIIEGIDEPKPMGSYGTFTTTPVPPVRLKTKRVKAEGLFAADIASGDTGEAGNPNQSMDQLNGPTHPIDPKFVKKKVMKEKTEQLNELSPETLASYKEKAVKSAKAADARGDFALGHKRFKGVVQATKKQFKKDLEPKNEDLDEGIVKTVVRSLTGRAEAARRAKTHYDQGDDIWGDDEGKKFRRNYKAARNYDRIATGNRSVKFGTRKNEEVEQMEKESLQEISKQTLQSYMARAKGNRNKAASKKAAADAKVTDAINSYYSMGKPTGYQSLTKKIALKHTINTQSGISKALDKTIDKRTKGIAAARARLTKQDLEPKNEEVSLREHVQSIISEAKKYYTVPTDTPIIFGRNHPDPKAREHSKKWHEIQREMNRNAGMSNTQLKNNPNAPYEYARLAGEADHHQKEFNKRMQELKGLSESKGRGADSKGLYRPTEQGAGLTRKGAKHYGVKTAVTTPPSKLDPKGKAAKRRKSFCARMGGMPGPMKDEKGRPTRKAMSLRRWNCEANEVLMTLVEAKKMKGKDPCWDNYEMVGTKQKNGREVPNCVPKK